MKKIGKSFDQNDFFMFKSVVCKIELDIGPNPTLRVLDQIFLGFSFLYLNAPKGKYRDC